MPLDGAESVICAFITSTSTEQIEVPRYPGIGLSVPGSTITGAAESPGVAYEVVGVDDQGDPIVLPEAQVEGDGTITEGETDDFIAHPEIMDNTRAICPGFSLLIGLTMLPMVKKKWWK